MTVTLEQLLWLFVWVWGSYYYVQYKLLKRRENAPDSTQTTKQGYRVHHRVGRNVQFVDVPDANTEQEAIRYVLSKKTVHADKIDRVERL